MLIPVPHRLPAMLTALGVTLACATACGSGLGDDTGRGGQEVTLTVLAAASLATTFERIAEEFEAGHDGVEVVLSFAGSSDLAAQIIEGAPADVFASADEATMDRLVAEGLAGSEPRPFATNTLQIAVPPGNPAGVEDLADLTDADVNLVVCAPQVPCGSTAVAVAEAAGVELSPVSEEQSVSDVLAKVTSGEADAGLVYVTDVARAGDAVEGIELDGSDQVPTTYPIAPVATSEHEDLATAFVALVLSETGRAALADAGFAPAP